MKKAKVNVNKPKAGPAPHVPAMSKHGGHHPATAKAKMPKGC